MESNRFTLLVILGGMRLGSASLASPSIRDFADGFSGLPAGSSAGEQAPIEPSAEHAALTLSKPLGIEQMEELLRGLSYLLRGQYREAVPILGKYALMGDGTAQSSIGSMYYFGMGLRFDRAEGVRWLTLAAIQGTPVDRAILADAANGTLEWESRNAPQLGMRNGYSSSFQEQKPNRAGILRTIPAKMPRIMRL